MWTMDTATEGQVQSAIGIPWVVMNCSSAPIYRRAHAWGGEAHGGIHDSTDNDNSQPSGTACLGDGDVFLEGDGVESLAERTLHIYHSKSNPRPCAARPVRAGERARECSPRVGDADRAVDVDIDSRDRGSNT